MDGSSFPSRLVDRRRVAATLLVFGFAAGLVTIPSAAPPARAAFAGQPWQTNFEIEPFGSANQIVQGPTPPAGGAGIDWDNAASFVQDFANPTEPCGAGIDPTSISGKLDDFNVFAPNPVPGLVLASGDICQAFSGWEVVNVTTATGATEFHYILYGGWRRNPVNGEISFYVPLIGGPTLDQVTLIKFNYDNAAGGSTLVTQLEWNGSTWVEAAITPSTAFNSSVSSAQAPAFGEFAVDLTAAGILPSTPSACQTFLLPYIFTQTGNAEQAQLKDILDIPNLVISNCSQVEITKVTNPPAPEPPATFLYDLDQVDGGPVQSSSPITPPNDDLDPLLTNFRGSLTVPGTPTDHLTDIIAATGYRLREVLPPPTPWSPQTVICNYFNPLVLDTNLNATPATVTLTNPDGTYNGQTFAVAPPGLLPAGVTNAVECTISNQAPSLTLVKQVDNQVRGPPATPDMWLLSATGPGGSVDYGPGTAAGVSRVVAPGTYTLAETRNTNPAPPIDYTDGLVWTCSAPVTGGNQVTVGPTDNVTCTITNTANPAQLTLQKVVDNTAGGSAEVDDFTLTATFATPDDPGSVDGAPITGVTGAAAVTDRLVKRGVFTLTETEIPGYAASWECVDATGEAISTANQVLVPVDVTDLGQLDVTCTVTNTFATLDIDISGSAINPVGEQHTFTLTATSSADGINFTPLEAALLDLAFVTDTGLDVEDMVVSNTCATPGTDANGQCTVTVQSSASGVLNVIANGFTDQGPFGPDPFDPFVLSSPVSSNKVWVEYRVVGAASDINLVGEPHTFTLSGTQIAGPNEVPLAQGAVITFTWSGPGTPTGPTVTPSGAGFQCTVAADGTCEVTVTSVTPATGTLTATGITVDLPNGETATSSTTFTLTYPDDALQEPAAEVTKSWAAFDVTVSPSAVNLIRESHPFIISVTQDLGAGPEAVEDGTIVDYAWAGDGLPSPPASCVTDGGECTVTVTSDAPGVGMLTVLGLRDVPVSDGVTDTVISSVTVDASGALTVPAPVEKRWVQVDVAISPGEDNLAGEPHTFTVQVAAFDGEEGFPDGGVPGAVVDASAVTIVGSATLTSDGTCDEGTNAAGQCTLIVTNPASGSIVVQLDQVSVTVNGEPFVVELVPGAPGLRADAVLPIQSDKVWWQYRVIVGDTSTNPLGETHTFNATVQRSNDGGATWGAVPDGTFLDHTWTDPNDVSTVDPASTCLTTGTVGGTCTFIVSSTGPTTGTLSITGIRDTWLDRNRDGDAGRDTDPTPDPAELLLEIVDIPASAFGTGSVLEASKTWWDFTVDVEGPAENPVGEDHTFTLTVQYSDGGPAGFQPVEPGTTLTYTWAGPTGSAEDIAQSTCDPADGAGTDASGQCTVVIETPTTPGTGTLTITGVDSTTIPDPTREISFTFDEPGTTQKTWIAYQALISPDATNLAGTEHPFTITVQQDRGAGFVAVPDGTILDVTLSNLATLVSDSCATGTIGGTCTVVVDAAEPGSVTVTPDAITVQLLDGSGATVAVTVEPDAPAYATPDSATKTWVSVAVTVTPPSETNLIGEPHTFTVGVDVLGADGTPTPLPAADGATVTWTFDGPGVLDAGSTTCDDVGTTAGTCDIVFTNTAEGSGTLTITSVAFTANGELFTVGLTAVEPGQATPPPITATKTWSDTPELTLVKSTSVTRILPGSTVPYSLTVTNVSAATANDIVVTDALPVGLTALTPPSGCVLAASAQVVTCTLSTLAPGEAVTFDIATRAADPFPDTAIDADGMVPNTATVTSPGTNCEPEPLQATPEDCESTVLLPVPPTIAVTKTSTSTQVTAGGAVPYVITVTNTGLVVARAVMVTDDLPVGLTFVSSVPPCTVSGQLVICSLGDLERGASATIDLVTRAADPFPTESLVNGEIVNVAVVSGTDSNCGDGSTDPACFDDVAITLNGPAAGDTTEPGDAAILPFTGATLVTLVDVGIVALAGGMLLLFGSRRRRMTRRA